MADIALRYKPSSLRRMRAAALQIQGLGQRLDILVRTVAQEPAAGRARASLGEDIRPGGLERRPTPAASAIVGSDHSC